MQEAHGLAVELSIDPGVDPVPEDITALLLQAARELLFNTVKHSGVTSASIKLTRAEERFVCLRIHDDGKGFGAESRDAGIPRADGGFGLSHITERMKLLGGKIDIDSGADRGTTITLTVPTHFGEVPAPVSAPPAVVGPVPEPPGNAQESEGGGAANGSSTHPADPAPAEVGERIRVLLADDHTILREGLAGLLRSLRDVEVIGQASDGLAALELARKLRPEVVVMDVSMPRLSGVEATSRIREEMPQTRVIALSMHAHEDMSAAMRNAGARAYFTKGGPSEPLIAAIRDRSSTRG
jgi:CheY-like chemotaxis protein